MLRVFFLIDSRGGDNMWTLYDWSYKCWFSIHHPHKISTMNYMNQLLAIHNFRFLNFPSIFPGNQMTYLCRRFRHLRTPEDNDRRSREGHLQDKWLSGHNYGLHWCKRLNLLEQKLNFVNLKKKSFANQIKNICSRWPELHSQGNTVEFLPRF